MPAQTQTFGLDISLYQKNVQWDRIKAAGMQFVFVKASESQWADPMFAKHWPAARGVLPRGAYHFYRQAGDPQKQVDILLKTLGNDPGELPPVLDVEDTSSNNAASLIKGTRFWLEQVEKALDRRPIIYTAKWYWDARLLYGGKYPDWASDYPLWVAYYPNADGAPTREQLAPDLPKPLKPLMPASWKKWRLWQYAEHGVVDGNFKDSGALASTDLDVFNGPLEDLLTLATGKPVPMPEATPSQTPPVAKDKVMLNQNVINAFNWAFGGNFWSAMQRAGLSAIVNERSAPYAGKPVKDLPGLTDDEKKILQEKWDAILAKQ